MKRDTLKRLDKLEAHRLAQAPVQHRTKAERDALVRAALDAGMLPTTPCGGLPHATAEQRNAAIAAAFLADT